MRFNHEILKSYGSSTPLAARRLVRVFAETSSHTATVLRAFFLWKGTETLHFVILLGVNGQKKTWFPKCHFQHTSLAKVVRPHRDISSSAAKHSSAQSRLLTNTLHSRRGQSFCLESHTRCVHFFEQSSCFPLRICS